MRDFSANLHKLVWFPVSTHIHSRKGVAEQTISHKVVGSLLDDIESLLEELKDALDEVPSPRATPELDISSNGKRRMNELNIGHSFDRSIRYVNHLYSHNYPLTICL